MTRHGAARAAIGTVVALAVAGIAITTALLVAAPDAAGGSRSDPPAARHNTDEPARPTRIHGAPRPGPSAPPHLAPSAEELALLPEARYDAVIPGLMGEPDPGARPAGTAHPSTSATAQGGRGRRATTAYSLLTDAPLYGADRMTPVARLAAVNFLGEPTVVVPIGFDGEWARVLTPARQQLPSAAGGRAAAQSSGWMRADALVHPRDITDRIVVSVAARSLTVLSGDEIVNAFDVGVGTPETPTPHGVTGYLQARYLDPAQGQTEHPVQLTSLHSSSADEPYGGSDGGLIGIHHALDATGTVSHGCIRLSDEAIRAVDSLPLGTPITVLE